MRIWTLFFIVMAIAIDMSAKRIIFVDRESGDQIPKIKVILDVDKENRKYLTASSSGILIIPDNFILLTAIHKEYITTEITPEEIENADTVFMQKGKDLKEFTVSALRHHFKVKPGKYIYDVDSDSTLIGEPSFEAFRRIPILNVSITGNISSLQGKKLVYKINGLSDPALDAPIENILMSLKAKYVKRIEMTENPNGDNPNLMEINIITKGRLEGYLSHLFADIHDSYTRTGIWGLTKIKNFTVSPLYSILRDRAHNTHTSAEEWRYDSEDRHYTQTEKKEKGFRCFSHNFELSMSYQFSDNTVLSAFGRAIAKVNPHSSVTTATSIYSKDMDPVIAYDKTDKFKSNDGEYNGMLNFESLFGKNGNLGKLYIGYEYYNRPCKTIKNVNFDVKTLDITADPQEYMPYVHYINSNDVIHSLLVEFKRRIGKASTLYLTGNIRHRRSLDKNRINAEEWEENLHNQTSSAISASYKYENSLFSLQTGVTGRIYHDCISNSGTETDHSYSRNSWVPLPYINLNYAPGNGSNYKVELGMNSLVADATTFDPYIFRPVPEMKKYGNPDLDPQHTYQLSMEGGWTLQRVYIDVRLYAAYTKNVILKYRFLDNEGILNETYGNIANKRSIGIYSFMTWRPSESTFFRLNLSGKYVNFRSTVFNNVSSGFDCYAKATLSQDMPWKMSLEAYGEYYSPPINFQGRGGRGYDYGISIVKKLLHNNLRFSLTASGFVPVYINRNFEEYSDGYCKKGFTREFHASFSFGISYSFGKMKSRIREVDNKAKDDDIKYSFGS